MKLDRLFRLATLLAALLACAGAQANAGFVQFVSGEARVILKDGSTLPAQKGVALNEGDTVVTGRGASAQLRMADDGLIALRPDSQLLIDTYRYNGREDGNERSVLGLVRGGFRTLTGAIGRANKANYLVRTPNATIGIRGTDHETIFIAPPAPGEVAAGAPGTYNKVNTGATFVETPAGRLDLGPNQVGFAGLQPGVAPIRLQGIPAFMRATAPQQGKDERRPVRESAQADQSGAQGSTSATAQSSTQQQAAEQTKAATTTQTAVQYVQATTGGTVNFAQVQAATIAPEGYVVVGGDKSGAALGNGGLRVAVGGGTTYFSSDGQLSTLSAADGFRYTRSGAAVVHSDSLILMDNGQGVEVKWGVYSGGAIVDNSGSRAADFFYFMGGQGTPLAVVQTLSGNYNTPRAHTKFITETGALGGALNSANINVNNGNLTSYQVNVTDAQGRTWQGCAFTCSVGSVGLAQFATQGVALTGTVSSGGVVGGNAAGQPVGPNGKGMISSFNMKSTTGGGVTGSFLIMDAAKP